MLLQLMGGYDLEEYQKRGPNTHSLKFTAENCTEMYNIHFY